MDPGFVVVVVVSTGLLLSESPKRMFAIPTGRPLKPGTDAGSSGSGFAVFSPGSFVFVSASSRFLASSSRVNLARSSLSFDAEIKFFGKVKFLPVEHRP